MPRITGRYTFSSSIPTVVLHQTKQQMHSAWEIMESKNFSRQTSLALWVAGFSPLLFCHLREEWIQDMCKDTPCSDFIRQISVLSASKQNLRLSQQIGSTYSASAMACSLTLNSFSGLLVTPRVTVGGVIYERHSDAH